MCKGIFFRVSMFFMAFLTTALVVSAQCNGVFFKPAAGKAINAEVYFPQTKNSFADYTGDGKVDLIGFRRDADQTYRTVYILPSNGAGGFDTAIEVPIITTFDFNDPSNFRVADFNLDGKMDFIIRLNTNPSSVIVYTNNGGGTFTALNPSPLATNERIINVADVSGDGRGDIITSISQSGGENYYYRTMNADGTFGINIQLMAPANFSRGYDFAADLTGDGKVDFPFLSGTSPNITLQVLVNQGNGTFALSPQAVNIGTRNIIIGVKDLNGDGKPEVIIGDTLLIAFNQGGGTFTVADYPTFTTSSPDFFDLDGDGDLDIFQSYFSGYSTAINNGAGVFQTRFYDKFFKGVLVGNLNNDNKADSVSFAAYRYYPGYEPKVFRDSALRANLNICDSFGQTKIVDFDADGITDLNFFNANDGSWRFRRSMSFALQSFTSPTYQAGDIPMPGDYDGEGRTDYAFFRPSNGTWYIRTTQAITSYQIVYGAPGDKPVSMDYNGDGRTDYAVYRPSTGTWYIYMSFNGGVQQLAFNFGASEDRPVPADYDGDGKTDIAVFRPSTGAWYVLRQDGTFYGQLFGFGTDVNVPADYDGDGKADIAVYRPGAQSYWYILRSSDNQLGSIPYGTTGDVPQAGDYNGDGVSDLAVYRPSTGVWYTTVTLSPFANFAAQTSEIPLSTRDKSY